MVYSNVDVLDENVLKTNFLKSLELKADNFLENSIHDIKTFFYGNGENCKICRDLVENNSDAFANGAFTNVDLNDENTCKFLCLEKGNNIQPVVWYKFWAYFLKFFFGIGCFTGLTRKYLNIAKESQNYNTYLNRIKLFINRDYKLVEPIKSLSLRDGVFGDKNYNNEIPNVCSDQTTIDDSECQK